MFYVEFEKNSKEEIHKQRKEKFLSIGKQKTFTLFSGESHWVSKNNIRETFREIFFRFKKEIIIVGLLIFFGFLFLF